jgi:hypothetical protein
MALPANPVSGGYTLTNSAGIDDRWTCPNCYEDHVGSLDGEVVNCSCGAKLKLRLDYQPVCFAECIDPDEETD